MSRVATLLRLAANALRDEAIKDGVAKIRDQDIATLAKTKPSTFSEWQGDESGNQQLSSLLAMFDYLERDKIAEILSFVLVKQKRSIKLAMDEQSRSKKKGRPKASKKKAVITISASIDGHRLN
jgi:hypothetical protein